MRRRGGDPLRDQCRKHACGILGHGLAQAGYIAQTGNVGKGGDGTADHHRAQVGGAGGVRAEPDIVHRAYGAIGCGEGSSLQVLVVVGVRDGLAGKVGADAFNARLCQRQQLARLRHAVAVGVFPDPQVGKSRVRSVHLAVVINIQVAKCGKPVGRFLTIGHHSVVAKQLCTAVDLSVAIAVPH